MARFTVDMLKNLSPRNVLGAARARVAKRHPYFTTILFKLRLVERPGLGTLSVDDGLRLFYDPAIVVGWGVEHTPAVVAHEVQHVLRRHTARGKVAELGPMRGACERLLPVLGRLYPGVDSWHAALNYAFDLEINDEVDRAGWTWPPTHAPLLPANKGFPEGKSGEWYLSAMLKKAQEEKDEDQSGDSGPGEPTSMGPQSGEGAGASQAGGAAEEVREGAGEQRGADQAPQARAGEDGVDAPPQSGAGRAGSGRGDGDGEDDQKGAGGGEGDGRPDAGDDGQGAGGGAGSADHSGSPADHPGHGCCGGCAGNPNAAELESDPSLPDRATSDEVEGATVKVADEVRKWKPGNGRGIAPGDALMGWANDMLNPPKVNAMVLLNKELRCAIAGARGHSVRKWGKPSRTRDIMRGLGWGDEAPLMPVKRGPRPRVVLVLDRSGSMGWGKGSRAARATSEALGFVLAAHGDAYGLAVDAAVQAAVPVHSLEDLMKLNKGGGGTDMRVGIRAAGKPELKADVIVLLTDGETPWTLAHDMPKARVVTLCINETRRSFDQMPGHLKAHAVYVPTTEEEPS